MVVKRTVSDGVDLTLRVLRLGSADLRSDRPEAL